MSKASLTTGTAIFPTCLGRRLNTVSAIRVPKGFDSLGVVKAAYLHQLSLGVGPVQGRRQIFRIGHTGHIARS